MLLPYYPCWNGPGPSVNNSSVSVCFITEHWHLSHLLKSNSHSWWDFAFVFVLQAGGERPNLSVWAHSVLSAWLMYFIRPVGLTEVVHIENGLFSLSLPISLPVSLSQSVSLFGGWVLQTLLSVAVAMSLPLCLTAVRIHHRESGAGYVLPVCVGGGLIEIEHCFACWKTNKILGRD